MAGLKHSRRRDLLRGGVLVTFGAGLGVVGFAEAADVADRKLPIRGGAASAVVPGRPDLLGAGRLEVNWFVRTDRKLVALTFDDGPGPRWTPMVLDILHQHHVPATFFMVGERARRHAALVQGRLAGHEVGSHSWAHHDLARMSFEQAYQDLARTHRELVAVTGQEPRLLRPPYGHLAGSTTAAAARLGYQVVLWSQQMREGEFPDDPGGHARRIVADIQPGTILLAHDVGDHQRLVSLHGLPEIIDQLRAHGYEFVTVSQLLAVRQP
ncbi:polysaccharide deacetylase family protein [Micromonospora zingiberis]|uniref:Polysaccharide deacetylase family protein n=1 Tax=Micromonospora zingiberis TaxID=2053011 RepID=A0A4R0G8Z3_9ACTN|nr:polysaccharide deacetylase family protein [Micromonospora zingiberis]TCB93414.1 polysaccharide deacetylase family protein [Micromonospora zingiberis]